MPMEKDTGRFLTSQIYLYALFNSVCFAKVNKLKAQGQHMLFNVYYIF